MKPRFSLILSQEGLGLLHRIKTGWTKVGEAALDDPDVPATLRALRRKAAELDRAGLFTMLVLPDDQILYTDFPLGDDDLDAQVRNGLTGLTPYSVDELVYDYEVEDDRIRVAAVARETLGEAEDFAAGNEFNPVGFTAMPDASAFSRAPWFGQTRAAPKLLPKGETVEPIGEAIRIVGKARTTDLPAPPEGVTPASAGSKDTEPTPPAPEEKPTEAPAEPPVDRPAFISSRSSPPVETPPSGAPETEHRLHLSATEAKAVPPIDVVARKAGITSPIAPEDAVKPKKKRRSAVRKKPATQSPAPQRISPPLKRAPEAVPVAPPPATTPTATPVSTAGIDQSLSLGLFAPKERSGPNVLLIAGAAAAALLAVVALLLWLILGGDEDTGQTTSTTFDPPAVAEVTTPTDTDAPAPEENTVAAALDPEQSDPELAPEPEVEPETAPVPEAMATDEMTADAARDFYDANGIWTMPPDAQQSVGQDDLGDLYIASIDPNISSQDAIALPAIGPASDTPPEVSANPPAQGARFDLDAAGRVTPSPEGTLSPEGILVHSGKPRLVPPPRPREDTAAGTDDADAALAESRLSALQPRPRPGNLQENFERTQLGGRTRTELGGLRPRARPSSVQDDAIIAALAEANANPSDAEPASALAIARSLIPRARPNDLASKAAATTASSAPAAPATVAPSIPSSASVSKQATLPNAINLRKINLIGVYGSSSDRRALVRLPSGRYVKLKVGDRLDGGKVAAIGDGELRYIKGGRNIVLKIPQG